MQYFQYNLLVQEELWAAVEAELLYAARQVDVAWEEAEAFHGAYVAKINDYLVWQWLNILAPCGMPIGLFVAVNETLGNALAKRLGVHKHHIPFVLADDIAILVEQLNLAYA